MVLSAGGRWYVGPDNGLFELVARRAAGGVRWWEITWRPERLSASFHGRDLFAPVAARIALDPPQGEVPGALARPADAVSRFDWPDDLAEVVYIDGFGNAFTGVRADRVPAQAELRVSGRRLRRSTTFSEVAAGEAFWYENANGLVEIAVNRGRADHVLDLKPGTKITINKM